MSKELKDFNQGHIWGRISSFTKKKSDSRQPKPYLFLTIECANELYGNVQTFARLWGEEKIDKFLDYLKQHPHDAYRFIAFFSQYEEQREGKRLSNFTVFKWMPSTSNELRASFILRGTITKTDTIFDELAMRIHVKRESGEGYDPTEEDFEVYLHPRASFIKGCSREDIKEGSYVEVAGFMRTKEPEDGFGRTSSDVRPYVMEVELKQPF